MAHEGFSFSTTSLKCFGVVIMVTGLLTASFVVGTFHIPKGLKASFTGGMEVIPFTGSDILAYSLRITASTSFP